MGMVWPHVFGRYSQRFYMKPTQEQMDDPDNLFALVYKVKQAMFDFGCNKETMSGINCRGFNRIVRHFVSTGLEKYDKKAVDDYADGLYESDLKNGASRGQEGVARKCAEILYRYYKTGRFEWFTLSHRDIRIPGNRFMDALEAYLEDCSKRHVYKSTSISCRRHALRRFMLIAESLGYNSIEDMDLAGVKKCMMSYIEQIDRSGYALSAIRMFLRHLHKVEKTNVDLSVAISRKASPHKKVLPGYDDAEIDALFNAIDKGTALGRREFAVMTTALLTGLRASDIAELKRSDIDWRNNEINIVQCKTDVPIKIWLKPEVGNAIADYIMNARPPSDSPYIFLRHVRPYDRLSATSISRPVRKYAPKSIVAEKSVESRGFHGLRRTFGIRLLKAETPLDLINEMLGHLDMDSSKPYLAADEKGLKNCAISLINRNVTEKKCTSVADDKWRQSCALPLIKQNDPKTEGVRIYV